MSPITAIAEQFGNALANTDYIVAHALLSKEQQQLYSPEELKHRVMCMTAYAPGPIREVVAMEAIDNWWPKRNGDMAWVYVALTGDLFSEAVTLVLIVEEGEICIRDIEWGRP